MKKIFKVIWNFCSMVKYKFLNLLSKKIARKAFLYDAANQEKYLNCYITFNYRARNAEYIHCNNNFFNDYKNVAIVIQGPIAAKDNFTIETIKYYRKMYKNIVIILTTWKDDNNKSIKEELKDLNVYFVENCPPEKSGLGNINYQTISTINGIKKAEELKVEYVLKTRTDQRIYRPLFIEFFMSLLKNFKPKKDYLNQKERVIGIAGGIIGGTMFIPYFVSDFLFFGNISDIKKYFTIEPDLKYDFKSKQELYKYLKDLPERNNSFALFECVDGISPEVIYFKNYINNTRSYPPDNTIADYWEILKNSFICISFNDLDLIWLKNYQINNDYLFKDNDKKTLFYNFDFQNWLSLYSDNIKYNPIFEEYSKMNIKEYKAEG